MIEVSQLLLLVLVEVIIGLLILSGLLLFFALRRKGRIRNAAHHLAERVKSDKPARSGRLKTMLHEKYGYEGEALEQAVHNISQAEMLLFQNLINGYIKDDQVHLQQIDVDEENLVLAYQGLKTPVGSTAPVADGEGGNGEELARLQEENKRLSDELRVTMDTMGRMLNEYSSMFAGGNDKPLSRASAAEAGADTDVTDVEAAPAEVDPAEQLSEIPDEPDDLLDAGPDQASALDEEVSEIIDEVMEIADEMDREVSSEAPVTDVPESLIDELEQVDIDVPELMPGPAGDESDTGTIPDPDPDDILEALGESGTDSALEALAQSETDSALEELVQSETDSALDELAQSETDSMLEELVQSETDSALEELAQSETDSALEALSETDPQTIPEAEPEPEPGSLEDEWAKLLEEDAESKQDPGAS